MTLADDKKTYYPCSGGRGGAKRETKHASIFETAQADSLA